MKKFNSVVFSLVLGFAILTPALSFSQLDLNLAERKFELGFYHEVIESLEDLSEKGELPIEGYLLLGQSYLKVNDPYRAELFLAFGKSRDKMAENPDFDLYLGKAAMMQGDYENARNLFLGFANHDIHLGRHFAQSAQVASGILETNPVVRVYNMPWNTCGAESSIGMLNEKLHFVSRSVGRTDDCGYWDCNSSGQLVATVDGDPFSVGDQLKRDLPNKNSALQLAWSDDGLRVAIVMGKPSAAEYRTITNTKGLSLYFAELDEEGQWESIIPFEHNGIGFSNMTPMLADNGTTLYFSSNRPGGFGGFDLYRSEWDGSSWSEPCNLGPEINSPGNEISPFLTGDHFFFSSDWHPGLGGLDVFYTSLSDPSVIYNAGRSINSTRDDFNFMVDADLRNGYLVSNRPGGRGLDDVYGFSSELSLFNLSDPSVLAEKELLQQPDEERKGDRMIIEFLSRSNAVFAASPLHPVEEIIEDIDQIDVFSVQIASFKNDFDEQRFVQQLGDIGEVYKVFYHTDIKVRVGSFFKEEEAEIALDRIRNRGFSDAFIVKEQIVVSSTPPGTAGRNNLNAIEQAKVQTPTRYVVRLGAFRNTSNIDGSWMDGDLIKEASGEFTVLLLGYFDTIGEAENARKKVAGRGFPDAFLMIDNNGERTRYRP